MSPRRIRLLAGWLVALAVVLAVAGTVISFIDGNRASHWDVFVWALTLTFSVAGYVIAVHHPSNAIGWISLGVGVAAGLARLTGAHEDFWVATGRGPRLLGELALTYSSVSWVAFILVPGTFLLLLFPDGHLLSPRWRPVAWCAAIGIVITLVTQSLIPGELENHPGVANPFGIDSRLREVVEVLAWITVLLSLMAAAVSLILRFRRSRGEQRLQLKWLALAGAVAGVTIPVMVGVWDVVGEPVAGSAIMLSVLGLPTATAVAIVRYRLYDIDVVINRTLVYGTLTAALATTYVGSVLLLQLALSGLTEGSGLAVAASTLAVAALFRPVRGRIQGLVDRRFFRSRYDAARTIEAFGARLRDEVNLAALSADLQSVVIETMRPAHVSLWLRTPEAPG